MEDISGLGVCVNDKTDILIYFWNFPNNDKLYNILLSVLWYFGRFRTAVDG